MALAVLASQLPFAPKVDRAFVELWESELRERRFEAVDVAKAAKSAVAAETRFPVLATFLSYCRAEKDTRLWAWRSERNRRLAEIEAQSSPLSSQERKALIEQIAKNMSDGARALFLSVTKEAS
jgi:hypothetical protein